MFGYIKSELSITLNTIITQTQNALTTINETLEKRVDALIGKVESESQQLCGIIVGELGKFKSDQLLKPDEVKLEQINLTRHTVAQLDKTGSKMEERLHIISKQASDDSKDMRDELGKTFQSFQLTFSGNIESFNKLQNEKFEQLDAKQRKCSPKYRWQDPVFIFLNALKNRDCSNHRQAALCI